MCVFCVWWDLKRKRPNSEHEMKKAIENEGREEGRGKEASLRTPLKGVSARTVVVLSYSLLLFSFLLFLCILILF